MSEKTLPKTRAEIKSLIIQEKKKYQAFSGSLPENHKKFYSRLASRVNTYSQDTFGSRISGHISTKPHLQGVDVKDILSS